LALWLESRRLTECTSLLVNRPTICTCAESEPAARPFVPGRYKAVVVEAEEEPYFQVLSTYIHLNRARAKLIRVGGVSLYSERRKAVKKSDVCLGMRPRLSVHLRRFSLFVMSFCRTTPSP